MRDMRDRSTYLAQTSRNCAFGSLGLISRIIFQRHGQFRFCFFQARDRRKAGRLIFLAVPLGGEAKRESFLSLCFPDFFGGNFFALNPDMEEQKICLVEMVNEHKLEVAGSFTGIAGRCARNLR